MADAKNYSLIPYETAIWSLDHAFSQLTGAADDAFRTGVQFHHPERGMLTVLAAMRTVIHDCHHHLWDIRGIIRQSID